MEDAGENLQESHETESRSPEDTKEEDEDVIERQISIPSNPSSHQSRVSGPRYLIRPSVKDCAFYLKNGWCGYRNCHFNHPQVVDKSKMWICKYFQRGYCVHGSACWYPHHMDGARVPRTSSVSVAPADSAQHLEDWLENLHLADNSPFENCGADHVQPNSVAGGIVQEDDSSEFAQNHMQNLASLSNARELDFQYFPVEVSMQSSRNSNNPSSFGGQSISMAEALRGSVIPATQPIQQNLPSGSAIPQQLPMHPFSQPRLPLTHFTNMIGYPLIPQNYPYMASAFQQTYGSNSSHHQQNENLAMWHHSHGSRTMSGVPANTYYNLQAQQQQQTALWISWLSKFLSVPNTNVVRPAAAES